MFSGPTVTFRYQGHSVTAHVAVLSSRLPYIHAAACSDRKREDVGFDNFHPDSKNVIVPVDWRAFSALMEWAYTGSIQPLLALRNDLVYWKRVAIIMASSELTTALKRYARSGLVQSMGRFFTTTDWRGAWNATVAACADAGLAFLQWCLTLMVVSTQLMAAVIRFVLMVGGLGCVVCVLFVGAGLVVNGLPFWWDLQRVESLIEIYSFETQRVVASIARPMLQQAGAHYCTAARASWCDAFIRSMFQ